MTPFPYQQHDIEKVLFALKMHNRVLFQASTGYGKTVAFAFIAKQYRRTLILCHREELVHQTTATLEQIGIRSQAIFAGTKKIQQVVDVYVGMVETVNNRLKKNRLSLDVDLVIADECHVLVFDKVFKYFDHSKILGVTATPVSLKKITFFKCKYCKDSYPEPTPCCGHDAEEWKRPFTFSEIYNDIVVGADIKHLIEFGQLVPEIAFTRNYVRSDELEVDYSGDYSTSSLDAAYGTEDALFNVLLNYNELCKGKRTMVFNSSTHLNKLIYEKFKEAGINARLFDSVNRAESGDRRELVEWFRNTPDAVLLNVGVFTAGFDCKEVEAIIINRATLSLSLFLQMCGRGGRASQKIFKDHFVLVDGGGNIGRFGEWSEHRDWETIFRKGTWKSKAKRLDAIDVEECPECGMLFPKSAKECPECGYVIPPAPKRAKHESNDIAQPIRAIPPPNAKKIYEYTKSQGENINFAFKVLYSRIVDMFIYYRVSEETYEKAKLTGEMSRKIRKMVYPCYFFFIKQDDIKGGTNRTLEYVIEKAKKSVENYYIGSAKTIDYV